jgi:hypothetical protein
LIYYLATNNLLNDPEAFRKLVQEADFASQNSDDVAKILGVKALSWRTVDIEDARKFWDDARSFANAAGFVGGERGLVINGRVLSKIIVLMKGYWANSRRS